MMPTMMMHVAMLMTIEDDADDGTMLIMKLLMMLIMLLMMVMMLMKMPIMMLVTMLFSTGELVTWIDIKSSCS